MRIILHYLTGSSDNVCSENDIRLSNFSQTTLPFYSRDTYSGRVEVCRNGEFVDVCNNTYNAQYFAQRACSYFSSGYSKQFAFIILVMHVAISRCVLQIILYIKTLTNIFIKCMFVHTDPFFFVVIKSFL